MWYLLEGEGKEKEKKSVTRSAAGQDTTGAGASALHGTAERQRSSGDSQVGREGLGAAAEPPAPRRAAASQSFGCPLVIARGAAGRSTGGSGSGVEVRWRVAVSRAGEAETSAREGVCGGRSPSS